MPNPFNPAPVTTRLQKMQSLFHEAFPPKRSNGCCVWNCADDGTLRMVDAMVETEASDGAVFQDLFLHIERMTAGSDDFATRCTDRLRLHLEVEGELLKQSGVPESLWLDPPTVWKFSQFLDYVKQVGKALPDFNGRIVVYLNPSSIADERAYYETIRDALNEGLPDGIILMLALPKTSSLLGDFKPLEYLGLTIIKPDLYMEGILGEMASPGPGSPLIGRFVHGFAHLSRLGASGDVAAMRTAGDRLLALSKGKRAWQPAAASVLATMGVFLFSKRANRGEALSYFRRARTVAEQALAEGDPTAKPVLVQSLGYEAQALLKEKKYREAAATFRRAAAEHPKQDHHYGIFDHLRQAMLAERKAGNPKAAWGDGLEALSALEQVPQGQIIIEIAEAFGKDLSTIARTLGLTTKSQLTNERILRVLNLT